MACDKRAMDFWTSPTPLAEPSGWLRFFAGFVVVVLLPGLFLLYRWARRLGPLWLLGACGVYGMLVVPLYGRLTEQLSLPFEFFGATLFGSALAYGLGRSARLREILDDCFEPLAADRWRDRWYEVVVLAAAVSIFVFVVRNFATLSAPAHVHDATNHAFLVARIAEIHSTAWRAIFAPPLNPPELRYLVGWHGTAALVSSVSHVAPYIVAWQIGVLAVSSLPLGFAVLWRHWGLSRGFVAAAAVVVASLDAHPFTDFRWGAFGMLIGLSLTGPAAVLLVQGVARRASLLVVLVVMSLVLIHAQAAWTAGLLAVACWSSLRLFDRSRRWGWRQALVALGTLVLLVGFRFIELAFEYGTYAMTPPRGELRELARVLYEPLRQVARDDGMLMLFLGGALVFALRRRLRPVFWVAAGMFVLHFTLHRFRDPISLALSTPLYQTPQRLLVSMLPLIIPMVVAVPLWLIERSPRHWQRYALAALLVVGLFSNARHARRHISKLLGGDFISSVVPFSASDYDLALKLREIVEPDAVVANIGDDGSRWAMHVSGIRFLVPSSWPQARGRSRVAVAGLLRKKWPKSTLGLRERGVRYLYLSDSNLEHPRGDAGFRDRVVGDPRFCELLRGPDSSLYRIEWEPVASSEHPAVVRYGDGFGVEERFGRWALETVCRLDVDRLADATALVFSFAGFPEQESAQRCEIWIDGEKHRSIEIGPRPWAWKSYAVDLPAERRSGSLDVELRFARRWPVDSQRYPLRALVVGPIRWQVSNCQPEIIEALETVGHVGAGRSR